MTYWLFDRHGSARLFVHDDRLISSDGRNLGWLSRNNVYSLHGQHLGWFENGILYDGRNCALAFQRDASGPLPYRPGLSGTPGTPGIPGKPGKPGLSGVPGRSGRGGWSDEEVVEFFDD